MTRIVGVDRDRPDAEHDLLGKHSAELLDRAEWSRPLLVVPFRIVTIAPVSLRSLQITLTPSTISASAMTHHVMLVALLESG